MSTKLKMTVEAAEKKIDQIFRPIIGQTAAKNASKGYILGGLTCNGHLPLITIEAPIGTGKSLFLNCLAQAIKAVLGRPGFLFNRGEEAGSKARFVEDVLVPGYAKEDGCAIYIDEAHELMKGIPQLIRTFIDVKIKKTPRTVRACGYDITFDPCMHNYIFATNHINKMDPAFKSRAERITLELYNDEQLMDILRDALTQLDNPIKLADSTILEIARCNRGSARDIIMWCDALSRRAGIKCGGSYKSGTAISLTKKDIREIITSRDAYPMGLTKMEVRTLLELEKEKDGMQLQTLAARNMCEPKQQKDHEIYLFQRGFLRIDGFRQITANGLQYLLDLREQEYIPQIVNPRAI